MDNISNILDGTCTGYYLNRYTYDPDRFNALIEQGMPMDEILNTENRQLIRFNLHGYSYKLIYSYEVNGHRYVRASYKKNYRKDKLFYIKEKLGNPYLVSYSTANPFISEIEHSLVEGKDASTNAIAGFALGILSFSTSFFVFPGMVLGLIGLILGIKAYKEKCENKVLNYVGIGFSSLGIIVSIIFVLIYICAILLINNMR